MFELLRVPEQRRPHPVLVLAPQEDGELNVLRNGERAVDTEGIDPALVQGALEVVPPKDVSRVVEDPGRPFVCGEPVGELRSPLQPGGREAFEVGENVGVRPGKLPGTGEPVVVDEPNPVGEAVGPGAEELPERGACLVGEKEDDDGMAPATAPSQRRLRAITG
jgi:hypothetical protein